MNTKKTILITGSSGGIGQGLIQHFAKQDYNLALSYFKHEDDLNRMLKQIPDSVSWKSYRTDIGSELDVQALSENINKDFGGVQIIINCAGINRSAAIHKLNFQDWDDSLRSNLSGPFLLMKHFLPAMKEQNFGRIVNMSSVVAFTGVAGTAAYAASKAGLSGLIKSVSKEIATYNITLNNIALGYMDSGMLYEIPETIREQIKQGIPGKKFGDPDEISALLDYMISEKASYLNGQTLHLNGGIY